MGSLEVEFEHIEKLDDKQLTRLLKKLLHLEADANGIQKSAVDVSLKINVQDDGEDGRIQWVGGPEQTDYIPDRFTLFQCKAGEMSPSECKKEILIKDGIKLKQGVQEIFDACGTYILLCSKNYNNALKKRRKNRIREGLREVGRDDWDTAKIEIYDAEKIADWVNVFLPLEYSVTVWPLPISLYL